MYPLKHCLKKVVVDLLKRHPWQKIIFFHWTIFGLFNRTILWLKIIKMSWAIKKIFVICDVNLRDLKVEKTFWLQYIQPKPKLKTPWWFFCSLYLFPLSLSLPLSPSLSIFLCNKAISKSDLLGYFGACYSLSSSSCKIVKVIYQPNHPHTSSYKKIASPPSTKNITENNVNYMYYIVIWKNP